VIHANWRWEIVYTHAESASTKVVAVVDLLPNQPRRRRKLSLIREEEKQEVSRLKCNQCEAALSVELVRGIGVASPQHKITKDRIFYFPFNIWRVSDVSQKVDISLIYSHIEVWSFQQFLTLPYSQYSHLSTVSFCIQLWRETELFSLNLQPAPQATWIPTPIASNDIALMVIKSLPDSLRRIGDI